MEATYEDKWDSQNENSICYLHKAKHDVEHGSCCNRIGIWVDAADDDVFDEKEKANDSKHGQVSYPERLSTCPTTKIKKEKERSNQKVRHAAPLANVALAGDPNGQNYR